MKKLTFLVLFLSLAQFTFAQQNGSIREEAKKISDQLVKHYGLNAQQEVKMLAIQERKLQNEQDFAFYKNTDLKMFYEKKRANQDGTKFSIERLLNKDQMLIYKKDQENQRLKRIAKIKELQSAGLTGEDLQNAIIDID
jgi:hypothetical protein